MKLYFSGLASSWESSVLRSADVSHVLVDPFDVDNSGGFDNVAMDSGAYRSWKTGKPLPDIPDGEWDFVVSPDVIGDADASYDAWKKCPDRMPVWHWGEPMKLLRQYLEECPGIVGIGGCVKLCRERSSALWHGLFKICSQNPYRYHVFGMNWIGLMLRLMPYLHSCDTSKWIDGARYAEVPCDDGTLVKRPELSREERCLYYADWLVNATR